MRFRLAIFSALLAVQANAATLYVSTTGSHDTNAPAFSTWATAATNIQAAIDAASNGDTVLVGPGTYYGQVTINKSELTVQGMRGTLFDADRTVIDRQGAASSIGVTFSGATNSVLRGFTVMGSARIGIYYGSPSNIVDSSVVRHCTGSQGVHLRDWGILRNSIIVGGFYDYGIYPAGVLHAEPGGGLMENCIVEANSSLQIGAWGTEYGLLRSRNNIHGNLGLWGLARYTDLGGNVTSDTTNSVCQLLDIAPASTGTGTSLTWKGVSAYIPRLGSLAQGAGVGYSDINAAKSGDGGPMLISSETFPTAALGYTNVGYMLFADISPTSYTVRAGVTNLTVLIVGGGGGGGNGAGGEGGGGGGGGGVVLTNIPVSEDLVFNVSVGFGGAPATIGQDSYFGEAFACGGGRGGGAGSLSGPGGNGASGGGGGGYYAVTRPKGVAICGDQGYDGQNGLSTGNRQAGGGGGAGGTSASQGDGGPGRYFEDFSDYGGGYFGGGGGGGAGSLPSDGSGGIGGGGDATSGGIAGLSGTGGGGGGGSGVPPYVGAAGGSGAVYIKDSLGNIDVFIKGRPYVATNQYNVGDHFLVSTTSYKVIYKQSLLPAIGPFNLDNPTIHPTYLEAF